MISTCLVEGETVTSELELGEAVARAAPEDAFVWIDVSDPTEEELDTLGEAIGVHELTLEDILSSEGRPRVEEYRNHLFLVFKALNLNKGADPLDGLNVNVLLFKDLLVTAHLERIRSIEEVRAVVATQSEYFQDGPAHLLYAILERVVTRYFTVVDEVEEILEDLEERVLESLDPEVPRELFSWKRKVVRARRRTSPHREVMLHLCTVPSKRISSRTQVYFRDVLEKVLRIDDRLAGQRELLQGVGELYLAHQAQRTNEVMLTLSIVATVVLPLNLLTGLYGTNFEVLPGAKVEAGFWIFLAAMAVMTAISFVFFRRRGWV